MMWRDAIKYQRKRNLLPPTHWPFARTVRTPAGIMFHEGFGQMQPMRTERIQTVEDDFVLRFERLQPGNYEVRLTSNAGHVERAAFTVLR